LNTAPAVEAGKPAEPTYEEKRAARVTRRQEKEAKRQYDYLKGVLRSQLRRQIDKIATENGKDLIFAMLNGARLQVGVSIEMPKAPEDEQPVDVGAATRALDVAAEKKPLIEVVRS
jgi:hypothetical protein